MTLKRNSGLKWTPPGGSETTHRLQHPLRLESRPRLRRRRAAVDAWDFSSRTEWTSSGSAEEVRVQHRFEDFPRRLLRLLDDASGGVQVDYYPDLARDTVFPLVLIEPTGDALELEPDSDRYGFGEYEVELLVRSADSTPLWPLYTAIQFNGSGGGTPTVDGAGQTGDSLDTTGWPASTTGVVLEGDVMRLGSEADTNFVRAASDVDSDGSGNATIPLTVQIGSDNEPSNGATVHTDHPMF